MIEPPISFLISPSEAKLLANNVTHETISDVTELDISNVLHGIHHNFDDVPLDRLINNVQEIQREKQQSRGEEYIHYAGVFTIIILVAVILLCVVYRTRPVSRCLISTCMPATTSSAEATPEEEMEIPEVSTSDGMSATAVYVKPGVRVTRSRL